MLADVTLVYGGPKGRAMRQYLSDSIHATVDDNYVTVDNNYVMVDNNYVMVDNNYATMSMRQFTMMTWRKLHDDWPDHCMWWQWVLHFLAAP